MTVCLYVFPPLLKHLKRVHPQLELRLTVATAGRSVEEIRAGRVDAGLLTLPVEESDLVTVPVLREELLLVTMPTHPLARKRRRSCRRIWRASRSCCSSRARRPAASSTRFSSPRRSSRPIVMDTENVEIIKAMVKTGLGIGIVPYQAIAREVRARQFFCARIEGHELVRETGWVYAQSEPRAADDPRAADGVRRSARRLQLARRAEVGRQRTLAAAIQLSRERFEDRSSRLARAR